jgi:opacity protein-like surface antigen
MNMKKIIFSSVLLLSMVSGAQENVMSTSQKYENGQKGMYVGVDYMNLTDAHVKITAKSDTYGNFNDNSVGGTHLGLAGVTLGYTQTPEQGLGFSMGARLLESFNQSEYGDTKLQAIIPEANLTLAANRYFIGYVGANAAVLTGSSTASKFKTQLGLQGGLGVRFTKNLALNAGYTMINQKMTNSDGAFDIEAEFQWSGFNSNVVYTF